MVFAAKVWLAGHDTFFQPSDLDDWIWEMLASDDPDPGTLGHVVPDSEYESIEASRCEVYSDGVSYGRPFPGVSLALDKLYWFWGVGALDEIADSLAHPEPHVRQHAAALILRIAGCGHFKEMHTSETERRLLGCLGDAHVEVELAGALHLARAGDTRAHAALERIAASGPEEWPTLEHWIDTPRDLARHALSCQPGSSQR